MRIYLRTRAHPCVPVRTRPLFILFYIKMGLLRWASAPEMMRLYRAARMRGSSTGMSPIQ